MAIKASRKDILWGYLSFALMYGMNLLLLPIILRRLDVRELGLWYIFLSVNQLVMFLDFGFMPTVLRNASFCWAGAAVLAKEGFCGRDDHSQGRPNYELLKQVVGAARRLYSIIGALAGLVLLAGGLPFLKIVARDLPAVRSTGAWIIFAAGIYINLRYAYWNPLLRGIGAIAESNKATVLARGLQLLVASIGLLAGGGLIAVAGAFLCGGVASRILMQRFLIRKLGEQASILKSGSLKDESLREVSKILWFGARRQGLAVLASSMIQQSDILVCATFMGLEKTAAYGITLQLFMMTASISTILFNTYIPQFNESGYRGDLARTRRDFSRTLAVSWAILGIGTIMIVSVGPPVLRWFAPDKHMLPAVLCLIMGMAVILETNYGLFYAFLTTRNRIPPPVGYLITGTVQVLMSVLLVAGLETGYIGILLSRLTAQLGYLSWRWPQLGLRELNCRLSELLKSTFSKSYESLKN